MSHGTQFHQRIVAALADSKLQSALDANADRRLGAQRQAHVSLPESWEVLRQRAHMVRAQTIADLDTYLEQFIQNAEANGMQVHRATDGSHAVQEVAQIAQRCGARLVAKSKSMVSEEIHLNQAMESAGIRVVETDLGEYIVQLRGEMPSHIITPAVHLSRQQVAQTFHEKLGLPLSEDIPFLTAAARSELRQVFLKADIGISGVNFGVAESGSICLLTNEGNGRMVTTVPPVHIALMGIERLVPTFEDLALMLYLLPRSATGQKLTVYASLIHGPRKPGEVDGPLERHLVLVDNGRSALRNSRLQEALYCIRCGVCLNACPVFREIGGHAYVDAEGNGTPYPGPIGSVVSPALFGLPEFGHLARASSLCGACKEACPVDIDLPGLLLRVRSGQGPIRNAISTEMPKKNTQKVVIKDSGSTNAPTGLRIGLRFFAWIASSPVRFSVAQYLAAIFSRFISPFSGWLRLPAFTGWGVSRDMPRPALRTFRHIFFQMPHSAERVDQAPTADQSAAIEEPPLAQESATISQVSLVDRFAVELESLGGAFICCREEETPHLIAQLLQEHSINRLQCWDEARLPMKLLKSLVNTGIQISSQPDAAVPAGLTGALAGVAETGTLVLPGGPGQPLSTSLLPEIHIALLQARDIYSTLGEALRLPEIRTASAIALVSGPSRTADIEMTLTIGVHGPRQVHVFCVQPDAAPSG